ATDLLLLALFQLLRQDTLVLLAHVADVLHEIGDGSTDDRMMQEQLEYWRSILGRLQRELPVLRRSLGDFFAFPYR
ncbi:hypothetical protein QBC34DRAFT_269697, partial [Podospora aff. communis PSN243]